MNRNRAIFFCYNQKQSSVGVLLTRSSYKFRKFHKKTPALKTRFSWSCRSTLYLEGDSGADVFFCEFSEILNNAFFKEPLGRLLLHKTRSVNFASTNFVPFQKRCHTRFPGEFFLGLICRLGTRVSSIFQTLTQKPIFKPVEHLRWSFFCENN